MAAGDSSVTAMKAQVFAANGARVGSGRGRGIRWRQATRFRALVALLWLAGTTAALAQPLLPEQSIGKQVVSVGSGASYVRYLLLAPLPSISPRPTAALVLFAGSNGRLALNSQGDPTNLANNFLVRKRMLFAQHNLFVAVVDMPNGIEQHARWSSEHAAAMIGLLGDLRGRIGSAKIWVVGTSSGALSAVSIAALYPQLPLGGPPTVPRPIPNSWRPNGVAIAAAQTDVGQSMVGQEIGTTCTATIFGPPARLPSINVPVYITADRDDACPCSKPSRSKDVFTALKASPARAMSLFPLDGSQSPPPDDPANTDPCTALTPHGFYMIEDGVVAAIVNWAKTH
jgi:hypothetical protein